MYHKLTNFFPNYMFAKILMDAEQGTKTLMEHPDLPLRIDSDTYAKSEIHTFIDTFFQERGYDTKNSTCRLQGTEPHSQYKVHQDTPSKKITLLIYVKGVDGTTFYESAYKENRQWIGENPTVDTFTPNAGYWFDATHRPFHSYANTQDTMRWVFMYNTIDAGVYDSVSRNTASK